ncbi:MAG: hypothetical protein H8D56_14790 [Planctomycetes bacterium]|nr:hypothetical protein [Planctomycetota bacterium]MBL7143540.1 hypothetical protein [Phycisphaerae bacterium]
MKYPTLAHFRHFRHFRHSFNYNIFPDTLYYAKQTQSQVPQNQPKLFCDKQIRALGHLVIRKNKPKTNPIQSQFKPKQTQFKPKQTQNKAKTKPIQTQFQTGFFSAKNEKLQKSLLLDGEKRRFHRKY